jgi:membrane-associated phospholipid phosphatase
MKSPQPSSHPNRRRFLQIGGAATVATFLADMKGIPLFNWRWGVTNAQQIGPMDSTRNQQAYLVRENAAAEQRDLPPVEHPTNGDDERYANKIASSTKALPHNVLGEVSIPAYSALLAALTSGNPADFEAIPLGGTAKLVNPQAAYAFTLAGADSHKYTIPPAPSFSSAQEAGEMAELYWQALTRDVAYEQYDVHPLTKGAADDLSAFSDFRGPKSGGSVTTGTLFRGNTPGDLNGPYISQFLWKDIPYGPTKIMQRYHSPTPGVEYMTTYAQWLNIQNGGAPEASQYDPLLGTMIGRTALDPTARYIRNNRDLGEYVHQDFTYQAFLNAALILLGLRAPFDAGNPYRSYRTQAPFITFGGPDILDLVARVANDALKASWFQKWLVHRRLRPEEFGGRVHHHKVGAARYPIHSELLLSPVLNLVFLKHSSYFLPMAYSEGCPVHPAYPAGHAVIAGACATIIKAFFDESFIMPEPVVASADGLVLLPYSGAPLTLGGEMNKLASNIAIGRDAAGVHWRSDGIEGLKLGEAVAISLLTDMRRTYTEPFGGFSLTKFDGTTVTV